jgi:hypothetical protein
MNDLTRRTILNALAGAAALAALGDRSWAQVNGGSLPRMREVLTGAGFEEFRRFLLLSSVLTGIEAAQLTAAFAAAKDPSSGQLMSAGADPTLTHKVAYFELALSDQSYPALLRQFESGLTPDVKASPEMLSQLAAQLLKGPQGDLARSITMAWYFGLWYEWRTKPKARFTVVSADAYAQGWVWRIAQAHAPGSSNLRFGYWAFEPPPMSRPGSFELKAIAT